MTLSSRRAFYLRIALILVVAAVWRSTMAWALPVIARDGVVFCQYADTLGAAGPSALQDADTRQHPLYPLLILGTQRLAAALGAPDTPLTWRVCGQFVSLVAGLAVIALTGWLTARLVRHLQLPVDHRTTVLVAMLLAALLDLNVWLSADVMSDQVHLACYLAAVCLLIDLRHSRAALCCGLLAGLAFLTRPEGMVPALAGLAVIVRRYHDVGWRHAGLQSVALAAGFAICAAPYWLSVGQFSAKKNPAEWLEHDTGRNWHQPTLDVTRAESAPPDPPPSPTRITQARLETLDLRWYEALPHALYKLLRAGRVVVPLLALLPLLNLRRRLLGPALIGPATCAAGHLALTLILLTHYGYLAPRHMLVIVMLLVPFAAMFLGRLVQLATERRQPLVAGAILALVLAPLATYALRVPNSKDAYLLGAAGRVRTTPALQTSALLLGGKTHRRVAFRTGQDWTWWPGDPVEFDKARHTLLTAAAPACVLIELESRQAAVDQKERSGHRDLLAELLADPALAARLKPVYVQPASDGATLHIFLWHAETPVAPR